MHPKNSLRRPPKLIRFLEAIEDGLLVSLLLFMLALAITQIGLRNFFDSGLLWADSLLRVLVLWVGLLGAMMASRKGSHINIDLLTRFASGHAKWVLSGISSAVTAAISLLLAWHSYLFVQMEAADGLIAFAHIPYWTLEVILPLAFLVIGLRYTALAWHTFYYRQALNQYSKGQL